MFNDEQIIEELEIGNLSSDQQQALIDEYRMAVGEAITGNLSPELLAEFEAIVNGDQNVIDAWLQENAPDFQTTQAYADLNEGFDEDPEKVPADKVFASIAWMQKNSPNFADTVAVIRDRIKANIAQYK